MQQCKDQWQQGDGNACAVLAQRLHE
jgi:hypothetical protein